MKKTLLFIIIIALSLNLCACAPEQSERGEGLTIVATVYPAYDFARSIVGEEGNVTLLIPPGSEAHSFEPTPQDIIRIESCDLLICNGGESEAWLEQILDGTERDINVISMLDCVDALTEEIKAGMQTKEEGGEEFDEHVWTSPRNAALIVKAISLELSKLDTANSALYTERCTEYCGELRELDAQFKEIIQNSAHRTLIFADRFPVRYFVEEYGLEYYAAFPGCAEDTEPSAKTVAFLIDRVKETQIPAVLYIEFSNQKMADVICEDTGCKKLLFHSCHNVSADDIKNGVSYLELMRGNVETVREALG